MDGVTPGRALFAPPIKRALRNDVYDALREAVLSGGLKRGQRVNEAEIARQMQISRAPIREAIRELEQEGLLVSVARRGTFVVSLSRDDVEEVYTLRADLEARAVRRAIEALSTEKLAALEQLGEAMRLAAASGDSARFLEADLEFHRTIVEAAGWPRLRKFWESLHPQTLTLYTISTLTEWSPSDHARRHDPLLAAIRTGDPERAAAAIQEHILGVGAQVMRLSPLDQTSLRPG